MAEVDLTRLKPYGDTMNDGMVQVSFTLPVPLTPEAQEAARLLALQMGLEEPRVVESRELGMGFSFFVLYGACRHTVDFTGIKVAKVDVEAMDMDEVNRFVREKIGRRITVVGACIETDAHTVGIDAILNMKGFAGEYGLERYPEFRVINMGAQVPGEDLVARAITEKADAILVSQVVTQKNIHVTNLTRLVDLLEAEGVRDRVILVVGGPRISHELATELGYDAGFGRGTVPGEVASFLARTLLRRNSQSLSK